MRDGLTLDGVLLVIQGEEDMGDVLELLDWGIFGEDIVPNEEYEFHEVLELDCTVM